MMALSGVRSSWLITAMKADLARLALSALSRAVRRAASIWRRCSISATSRLLAALSSAVRTTTARSTPHLRSSVVAMFCARSAVSAMTSRAAPAGI